MFDIVAYALAKAFTKKSIEEAAQNSMQKSVYDRDNDGVVDNAMMLNGNRSSYYAKVTDLVIKNIDGVPSITYEETPEA